MRSVVCILFAALTLAGCATTPRTPEEQATASIAEAKVAFASIPDSNRGLSLLEHVLSLNTGPAKARDFLATNPTAKKSFIDYLGITIKNTRSVEYSINLARKFDTIKNEAVLPAPDIAHLQQQLSTTVAKGNLSGNIPFTLADNTAYFPELGTENQKQALVKNSVANLKEKTSDRRALTPLLAYAAAQPEGSPSRARIQAELPLMNIRRSELEAVATVFPAFASTRAKQMTATVLLSVKNGDRLMADDLQKYLGSNLKGITWVKTDAPEVVKLEIEKIRENEKIIPESSQTITYAQHEVNLLSAALLMPRNASYIYTITSGGAEIEYGFGVTAISNGEKIHDDLVRGKVGGTYARCENARIQNVFGGVTSAGFVANDDMQRRCNGQRSVQVEDLRRDVLSKILESVKNVPQIATSQLD